MSPPKGDALDVYVQVRKDKEGGRGLVCKEDHIRRRLGGRHKNRQGRRG